MKSKVKTAFRTIQILNKIQKYCEREKEIKMKNRMSS